MPDLVARLSGLHATLTARLALQESLLSLSGRLDMVLSQIEMRASAAPATLTGVESKVKADGERKREVGRYVEGESDDDEDEEDKDKDGMEVEVESGDDAGSVEDVELGGSDEDDDEEEDDDDLEEDEEGDSDGAEMNGFIDDEAEEFDEESDEDESE
jgi:U3 small nucleolar RNA-associated protein 5